MSVTPNFQLVANNGYRKRTPPREWIPDVIRGGLCGVPKKAIDFVNPYRPENQVSLKSYVPVKAGDKVIEGKIQTLDQGGGLSRFDSDRLLRSAFADIDRANASAAEMIKAFRGHYIPENVLID